MERMEGQREDAGGVAPGTWRVCRCSRVPAAGTVGYTGMLQVEAFLSRAMV